MTIEWPIVSVDTGATVVRGCWCVPPVFFDDFFVPSDITPTRLNDRQCTLFAHLSNFVFVQYPHLIQLLPGAIVEPELGEWSVHGVDQRELVETLRLLGAGATSRNKPSCQC
jgi:hypothetical protein